MAPQITHINRLDFLVESFETETQEFLYTTFGVFDKDGSFWFGQLNTPKLKITAKEFEAALDRIPDADVYPEFPSDGELTRGPDEPATHLFIKRARLARYEEYKGEDYANVIPTLVLEEARMLETLSKNPHPFIVKYHGCCVHRGRITGLVMDKHPNNLKQHLKEGGKIDVESFMAALESAVSHLHSLNYAHNDLNPRNVLIDSSGSPVLIDFDSCRIAGEKLSFSRGTPGWMDTTPDKYDTSEFKHDLYGLEKIREWLKEALEVL